VCVENWYKEREWCRSRTAEAGQHVVIHTRSKPCSGVAEAPPSSHARGRSWTSGWIFVDNLFIITRLHALDQRHIFLSDDLPLSWIWAVLRIVICRYAEWNRPTSHGDMAEARRRPWLEPQQNEKVSHIQRPEYCTLENGLPIHKLLGSICTSEATLSALYAHFMDSITGRNLFARNLLHSRIL